MSLYLYRLVQRPSQEELMRRSSAAAVQVDLFINEPTASALTALQNNRAEIVAALSQMLWQVVQALAAQPHKETDHEQDQC